VNLSGLKIKIFADGADIAGMKEMNAKSWIKGFTTNPTLMRKAGVSDYEAFAGEILKEIKEKPISFEVFSDDIQEMERQALKISSWGKNVNVKIPVTNTKRQSTKALIEKLAKGGVSLNITAVMTLEQVKEVAVAMKNGPRSIISVFAGRIADSGVDPVPIITAALKFLKDFPNVELLWASPREVLNIVQADSISCHIITVTNDLLKKLDLLGKSLAEFSLDTVKMFYDDAQKAGYKL